MAAKKLKYPSDHQGLEEIIAASRRVAESAHVDLTHAQQLLTVAKHEKDPRFQHPRAQEHLASELDRITPILRRPKPIMDLQLIMPHMRMSSAELAALPKLDLFKRIYEEAFRIHKEASAKLKRVSAAAMVDRFATAQTSRQPRDQGKTNAALEFLKDQWRSEQSAPTYTDLMRRLGFSTRSPAYAAYERFYQWPEYIRSRNGLSDDHWGPGPKRDGRR
jgi:hypothetical protein